MTVPPSVLQGVESALAAQAGKTVRIESATPVGGGCINPSARLTDESGESFFLKWNPASSPEMFNAEADGLSALAEPGALRVPAVLGTGGSGTSSDPGWLLLEFIPQGRPGSDYGGYLGEGLAELHSWTRTRKTHGPAGSPPFFTASTSRSDAGSPFFGWRRDNFIGSLPQANNPKEEWETFWRDARLEPQLRMAREGGHFSGRGGDVLDELMDRLHEVMAGAGQRGPELLHGDLWSGNYYPGPSGEPVLIDPAVYCGVGEVDLAMMELFGSFPRGFWEGYDGRRGVDPAYDPFRRNLYQLYYLLVHVNLFGSGYVGSSLRAAEGALRGY
jgi:fructosamine-3-kinase